MSWTELRNTMRQCDAAVSAAYNFCSAFSYDSGRSDEDKVGYLLTGAGGGIMSPPAPGAGVLPELSAGLVPSCMPAPEGLDMPAPEPSRGMPELPPPMLPLLPLPEYPDDSLPAPELPTGLLGVALHAVSAANARAHATRAIRLTIKFS